MITISRPAKLFLFSILIVALAGCSPLTLVNSLAPDHGFVVEQGKYYGQRKRQKLDVYYPEVTRANAPVIVFFYGGSWRRGDRERYRFVGQALSSQGYLTIIPDYRLYPEVQFPAFVEDGAASVAWIKQNIPQSENGIVLIGHSAGAHLAALLALDGRYLHDKGVRQNSIIGMIGLAGPYAFEPEEYRRFRPIFATAKPAELSQPVSHARGDAPPLLLLHGTGDRVVLPLHSQLLQERINLEDGRVNSLELEGVDHFGIVLALSEPFSHLAPNLLPNIEAFIEDQI
ncbi:MAG: alpha/beta hydrolase [Desulfobacterales bacterium]|nr:alpha/beta hydrolase [Desulfobacterales bacterium]